MEVGNDREIESPKQCEQMATSRSSVNAKFMLYAEHIDIRRLQEVRCQTITGQILFGDFESHIRRIGIALRPIIYGNDETFRP